MRRQRCQQQHGDIDVDPVRLENVDWAQGGERSRPQRGAGSDQATGEQVDGPDRRGCHDDGDASSDQHDGGEVDVRLWSGAVQFGSGERRPQPGDHHDHEGVERWMHEAIQYPLVVGRGAQSGLGKVEPGIGENEIGQAPAEAECAQCQSRGEDCGQPAPALCGSQVHRAAGIVTIRG